MGTPAAGGPNAVDLGHGIAPQQAVQPKFALVPETAELLLPLPVGHCGDARLSSRR
jgi:hypothetical protein